VQLRDSRERAQPSAERLDSSRVGGSTDRRERDQLEIRADALEHAAQVRGDQEVRAEHEQPRRHRGDREPEEQRPLARAAQARAQRDREPAGGADVDHARVTPLLRTPRP
jgi:hypothetical protein